MFLTFVKYYILHLKTKTKKIKQIELFFYLLIKILKRLNKYLTCFLTNIHCKGEEVISFFNSRNRAFRSKWKESDYPTTRVFFSPNENFFFYFDFPYKSNITI